MAGKRPYKTWPLAELEELEQTRLAVGQRIPAALKEALAAARLVDAGMPVDEVAALEENGQVVEGAAELAAAMDAEQAAETEAEIKARRKEFTKRVAKLMDGGFSEGQAVEALTSEFPQEAAEYRTYPDPAPQPPERRPEDVDPATGELLTDRSAEPAPAEPVAKPAEPYALVEAVAKPVTYYWAQVTICTPNPDGGDQTETITCQCPYGHEREDLAIKHAKKLAAERGARVA